MTKIKMLNDRIIFDGHADSRQECETITLMCDNLAKSKDFKTIRYESGYAEFEKVGQTNELKFVSGSASVTINFDEHITKVTSNMNLLEPPPPPMPTTATWTTSGENVGVMFSSAYQVLNVILADGYVIDTVTGTETPYSQDAQPITFSEITDNSFAFSLQDGADYTITITSKIPAPKQTIDVSTLSGWANLSTGNHQITIKTKASGYADSAASNAVTVSKAASGHKLTITTSLASGAGADLVYMVDGEEHTSGEGFGDDPSGTYVYENVSTFQFDIDCGRVPSIGATWSIVSTQLGINLIDQNVAPNIAYSSATFTLTEDTVVTYTTSTSSGHKVYISGSQDTTMGGYAYYSTDNGATWEPLAGGYGWSATNELVGTFTQIKFKIEADAHKLMPYCDLSSTALGLSLHASNGETQISDNYKLTEDITDLTFEAYGP